VRLIFIPIFILVTIGNSILFAQSTPSFSISGTISDESGEPLMATIVIHELGTGTSADLNGNFILKNLNPGNYHLHVSHLGYK